MSGLDAFSDCGLWELSSLPSPAEEIYRAAVQGLEGAFDMTPGTFMEACTYADAMALADAKESLIRAANQAGGATAWDLLPILERLFGTRPLATDSVASRGQAVALAQQPALGASIPIVTAGLNARLPSGTLLAVAPVASTLHAPAIGYPRPTVPTLFPADPSGGPGNWVDTRTPANFLQLIDPVLVTGSPIWVAYESLDTSHVVSQAWIASSTFPASALVIPSSANWTGFFYSCSGGTTGTTEPTWPTSAGSSVTDSGCTWTCVGPVAPQLAPGQTVTVQTENSFQAERVTVLAVAATPPAGSFASTGGLCFQAQFENIHDAGASIVTGRMPFWTTTRRQIFLVLSGVAAQNGDTRRIVNSYMPRASRAVDQWAIVKPTSTTMTGGTLGPLMVGSPMGCVPVGVILYTNTQ